MIGSIARQLIIPCLLVLSGLTTPVLWSKYIAYLNPIPLTFRLDPHAEVARSKTFQVKKPGFYGIEIELKNDIHRHLTECLLGIASISPHPEEKQESCPESYHYQPLTVVLIENKECKICSPSGLAESYTADYIGRWLC